MKNLFILLLATCGSILFNACSSDTKPATKDFTVSTDDYLKPFSSARLADHSALFTYTTVAQAETLVGGASASWANDAKLEIPTVTGCTRVVGWLNLYNGAAVVTDYFYVNDSSQTILQHWHLNSSTGQYTAATIPGLGTIGSTGVCPSGYSNIGDCSFSGGNVSTCMGQAQATYINAYLSSVGDCINFQLSVETTQVTVCAKRC